MQTFKGRAQREARSAEGYWFPVEDKVYIDILPQVRKYFSAFPTHGFCIQSSIVFINKQIA